MADEIRVSTKEINRFLRALKATEPGIRKHLVERLRLVGAVVAQEARSRIEPYSGSVPDSIKVRVSGMTVSVVAGGSGVPMAALLELGNQESSSQDAFRHPVFGNRDNWVEQPMHPYLSVALASKITEVETAAASAVDETISELANL